MRPPDERQAAAEHEIQEAERALGTGRLTDAAKHLRQAERDGGDQRHINRLDRAIKDAKVRRSKTQQGSKWAGFLATVFCYLLLSIAPPRGWTYPVWIGLAFVAIPLLGGYIVGRMQGVERDPSFRFRGAMIAIAWAMFFYTVLNLMVIHGRIETAVDPGAVFLVVLFVGIVYALIAGVVAGFAASRLAWRGKKAHQ